MRLATAADVTPLDPDDLGQLGEMATADILETIDPSATRIRVHEDQAFLLTSAARDVRLASLEYWSADQPTFRCALALRQNDQLTMFPADMAEPDQASWNCDGAPALRFSDVTADDRADILAMYPFMPPSNEPFYLPLLLSFDAAAGAFVFDEERTRWLAAWQEQEGPLTSLKQMEQLLSGYQP